MNKVAQKFAIALESNMGLCNESLALPVKVESALGGQNAPPGKVSIVELWATRCAHVWQRCPSDAAL